MPASRLHAADQVRRADGRYGVVRRVVLVVQPQAMYNLTVAGAHTYFVGDGQWLVHNCPSCVISPRSFKSAKIDEGVLKDLVKKAGKPNAKKFGKALQNGVVAPQGKSGIKILDGLYKGRYTHELKIEGSSARIFGYINEHGELIFDLYEAAGAH